MLDQIYKSVAESNKMMIRSVEKIALSNISSIFINREYVLYYHINVFVLLHNANIDLKFSWKSYIIIVMNRNKLSS